jgi:hypothetical protein
MSIVKQISQNDKYFDQIFQLDILFRLASDILDESEY